ncbi:MAG: hypothetical protein ABJD24_04260 [Acidimicrobiales bacterium]
MSRTPYLIAASAASLVAGAAIGATLLVPSAVNAAQDDPTTTVTVTSGSGASGTGSADAATPTPPKDSWVDGVLKPLVDAGTITQAQADAVKDALSKARPAFPGGRKPEGRFGGPLGKDPAKIAAAIGITEADLKAGLVAGKTLAELATENGKDPAAVAQVIIDDVNARIDAALSAGRITQAQADQMKADAKARADDIVNGKAPLGPGRPHRGGFGPDEFGPDEFGPPPTPPTVTN